MAADALAAHGAGPDRTTTTDVAPPNDDGVLLVRALRQLPEHQRRALALHYLYDMSVEEIAMETDAPTGTVKSWLSRGRAALAVVLGDRASEVNG